MWKKALAVVAVIVVLGCLYWGLAARRDAPDRPAYARSTLTVTRTDGQTLPFAIEIAHSDAEQAYGLMFVRTLAANDGMIFPYDPPRDVAFWMKNTLIPLDMLFVRADHTIGHIVVNARPLDLTPIPSEGPVIAVIEINGGQSRIDNIQVGDKVEWPHSPLLP